MRAVKQISIAPEGFKDACLKHAKKFDTSIFLEKINEMIATTGKGEIIDTSRPLNAAAKL
jgi:hypothetical protein